MNFDPAGQNEFRPARVNSLHIKRKLNAAILSVSYFLEAVSPRNGYIDEATYHDSIWSRLSFDIFSTQNYRSKFCYEWNVNSFLFFSEIIHKKSIILFTGH